MQIKRSIRVNIPIDKAWEILGPNYVRVGDWASSVYISTPRPGEPAAPGAPVSGRVCQTSIGPVTESIVAYEPQNHRLVYKAQADAMPGFVRGLQNQWTLRPAGPRATDVDMRLTIDIAAPFNILMGWMMRLQMSPLLKASIEEFKHFAETGKAHPRKVKADQSKKAAAVRSAALA